jgi:acetyl-CoA C-acetyltransferase
MGVCADLCAKNITLVVKIKITSQFNRKSSAKGESGKFDNEVVPVSVPQRKGDPIIVSKDEEFTNVKLDKIPSLNAVFTKLEPQMRLQSMMVQQL